MFLLGAGMIEAPGELGAQGVQKMRTKVLQEQPSQKVVPAGRGWEKEQGEKGLRGNESMHAFAH